MNHSVLVHWKGRGTFNDTIDAHCELSKLDAGIMADIYCSNAKTDKVDIIRCVDGDRTFKNIKENGVRT